MFPVGPRGKHVFYGYLIQKHSFFFRPQHWGSYSCLAWPLLMTKAAYYNKYNEGTCNLYRVCKEMFYQQTDLFRFNVIAKISPIIFLEKKISF